ncbi:UDP-N-acetylgalactosamine-undecaprenyl-phosphate N-acetylgalactosaminephosphotransferase [bacterium HR35]|nr:UDP-N-acetylgalactosamine-undecaprenyl-phosphate N-acetylgalactosaminephosphotransferase [bacterium HR35]
MGTKLKDLIFFFVDFFTFYLALILALILRHLVNFNLEILKLHFFPFFIVFVFWFFFFYIFDLYNFKKISFLSEYSKNYLTALFISLLFTILLFYFLPLFQIAPKTLLLLFILIFVPLNLEARSYLLKKIGEKVEKNIALIGEARDIDEIENYLLTHQSLGFKKVLRFRRLSEVYEDEENVDYLVVANDILRDEEFSKSLLDKVLKGKVVLSSLVFIENFLNKINLEGLNEEWFLNNVFNKDEAYEFFKRIIDVLIAGLALIISLPLWPIIILGIKISSPGPIFFKDSRVGKNEKTFILYKFRTMHVAEYKNPKKEKVFGVKEDDPRIFFWGKILRRLHLDELPQALNVLKGDLSLVGPRPDSKPYYDFLKNKIPLYSLRTLIKPGITGWAQINEKTGDSIEEAKERLEYDFYYLKNRNLILDIIIILRTLKIVLTVWGK